MPRITHHNIRLRLRPDLNRLEATDELSIDGRNRPLVLHLNPRLALTSAVQGARPLAVTRFDVDRLVHGHRIDGWMSDDGPLTVTWSGCLDQFEGYRVTIIRPDCVELSGFGNWFPTIERQSQLERFTYELTLDCPPGWEAVVPGISLHGDARRTAHSWTRPIEDILVCAAPSWQQEQVKSGGTTLRFYATGISEADMRRLGEDFSAAVAVAERHFGPMAAGYGGAFVVVPRGPEAADWGYERGDMWVVGDGFVNALLANGWCLPSTPGPTSLALHETIHAWFGQALSFEDSWLMEAVTQYLQVVLTEEMFGRKQLADDYFEWYRGRIAAQLAKDDRAISALTITDQTYVYWYLKGSWAFWDIEALTGRDKLLAAIADTYRKHRGTTVGAAAFCDTLSGFLGIPLRDHFAHWFDDPGFAPRYRV